MLRHQSTFFRQRDRGETKEFCPRYLYIQLVEMLSPKTLPLIWISFSAIKTSQRQERDIAEYPFVGNDIIFDIVVGKV